MTYRLEDACGELIATSTDLQELAEAAVRNMQECTERKTDFQYRMEDFDYLTKRHEEEYTIPGLFKIILTNPARQAMQITEAAAKIKDKALCDFKMQQARGILLASGGTDMEADGLVKMLKMFMKVEREREFEAA